MRGELAHFSFPQKGGGPAIPAHFQISGGLFIGGKALPAPETLCECSLTIDVLFRTKGYRSVIFQIIHAENLEEHADSGKYDISASFVIPRHRFPDGDVP